MKAHQPTPTPVHPLIKACRALILLYLDAFRGDDEEHRKKIAVFLDAFLPNRTEWTRVRQLEHGVLQIITGALPAEDDTEELYQEFADLSRALVAKVLEFGDKPLGDFLPKVEQAPEVPAKGKGGRPKGSKPKAPTNAAKPAAAKPAKPKAAKAGKPKAAKPAAAAKPSPKPTAVTPPDVDDLEDLDVEDGAA